MSTLRILFITPYVPSPLRARPFGFLQQLARHGHRLTLLSAATSTHDLGAVTAVEPLCERLEIVRISRVRSLFNCARGAFSDLPFQALYCDSPGLHARLTRLLTTERYDVVHIEHLRAALVGLAANGVARIFDAVDCISGLLQATQRHGYTWESRLAARIDLQRTRRFEAALVASFPRTIATSPNEASALVDLTASESESTVEVVPNGVDLDYFSPNAAPRDTATLLYVGRMSYHANIAAVVDLVERIMPTVWALHPEARLVICGADPGRAVLRLAGPRVDVTGTVADVRPYLRRATLSVNPLRYAAGIQNKVLEAMASGTPVIASPAACAGLVARDGRDLLVARSNEDFARCVTTLLSDATARLQLATAARAYVETHHSWTFATERLEAVYRDAISRYAMMGVART